MYIKIQANIITKIIIDLFKETKKLLLELLNIKNLTNVFGLSIFVFYLNNLKKNECMKNRNENDLIEEEECKEHEQLQESELANVLRENASRIALDSLQKTGKAEFFKDFGIEQEHWNTYSEDRIISHNEEDINKLFNISPNNSPTQPLSQISKETIDISKNNPLATKEDADQIINTIVDGLDQAIHNIGSPGTDMNYSDDMNDLFF